MPSKEELVARTAELLASGVVTPVVDRAHPLEAFREAFARMVCGDGVGRVVLTP